MGLSAIVGYSIGDGALTIRMVAAFVAVIYMLIVAFLPTGRVLYLSYLLWISTFLVGWRQVWITPDFRIHPAEVLIWALMLSLLMRRAIQKTPIGGTLPPFALVMALTTIVGLTTALTNDRSWEVIGSEMKLYISLLPVLVVTESVVESPGRLEKAALAFYLAGAYVAVLGVFEYLAPSLVVPLRGYFGTSSVVLSQQGFQRAEFSFFGGAQASVFIVGALFAGSSFITQQSARPRSTWIRAAVIIGLVVCLAAIYVSGMRGVWAATIVGMLVTVTLNPRRAWLLLVPLVALPLAPESFFSRIESLYDPIGYYDTSVTKRESRIEGALAMVTSSPIIGHGWGASGWVHNDPLQVAANLGLPALAVYLYLWGSTAWRLYVAIREPIPGWPKGQEYGRAILAALAASFVCVNTEFVIVLPYLLIPMWFLLAVARRITTLASELRATECRVVRTSWEIRDG